MDPRQSWNSRVDLVESRLFERRRGVCRTPFSRTDARRAISTRPFAVPDPVPYPPPPIRLRRKSRRSRGAKSCDRSRKTLSSRVNFWHNSPFKGETDLARYIMVMVGGGFGSLARYFVALM